MGIKARKIVNDQPVGGQVDLIRQGFNTLLIVLDNIATQVSAGTITATEGQTVLKTTLQAGVDSSITGVGGGGNNYTGTGLPLIGVLAKPKGRRAPRNSTLKGLSKTDKDNL